ncbi:hypothetical protein C2E23DRAFT_881420 [Lenzites betulinus]|nr:hypothetical protein C2E23DRAFT_881420 [Lenzites betulinus]
MPRVDPAYPSIASVLSAPKPRSPPSLRLPAYRASHVGRYHPYPRFGRATCQERLTDPLESRYEEDPVWEDEQPVVQPLPRGNVCVEAPDDDASPYDDEPFVLADGEHEPEPQAAPGPDTPRETTPAGLKLAAVAVVLLAALRRRYLSRLQVIKGFLQFD